MAEANLLNRHRLSSGAPRDPEEVRRRILDLRAKAAHARDLSLIVSDGRAERNLMSYAVDLERDADALEQELKSDLPARRETDSPCSAGDCRVTAQ